MRYVLTVDRSAIDRGESENLLRVEDTRTGQVFVGNDFAWDGPSWFRTDPEGRLDGARAWVETDEFPIPGEE